MICRRTTAPAKAASGLSACCLLLVSGLAGAALAQSEVYQAIEKASQQANLDPARIDLIRSTIPEAQQLSEQTIEWLPVGQAPPSFPVPLFRGSDTRFLKTATPRFVSQVKDDLGQLTLQTRDPVSQIVAWYQRALPQAGFKLEKPGEKLTRQIYAVNAPGASTMRAESDTVVCAVTCQSLTAHPPLSMIYISTMKKGRF